MKATPTQQAQLLDLQQADLDASRLRHQMAKHPLRDKLSELAGRAKDLERHCVGLQADIQDKRRALQVTEDEVAKVRERGRVQQERLDSGKVGIRDMSAVEHEIAAIEARREALETSVLEQMEALEDTEARLAASTRQAEVLAADEQATNAQLVQELTEPTRDLEDALARRRDAAGSLDDDLVAEYERLRERQGPVVVLRLEGGELVNSPVYVTQEEIDRVMDAPADELWVSDETGYLIARPA